MQFLQHITLDYTKKKLAEARNLLDTSFDAGLSGPSRLHDLFVTFEAMTPGQYKQQGEGLVINYGIHATPFGSCLLATTSRGICALRFVAREGSGVLADAGGLSLAISPSGNAVAVGAAPFRGFLASVDGSPDPSNCRNSKRPRRPNDRGETPRSGWSPRIPTPR